MQVLKRLSNNEKASNANCPRQGHGKSLGIKTCAGDLLIKKIKKPCSSVYMSS